MSIRTLRIPFILICSCLLCTTSLTASAVLLDLQADIETQRPSLETLLQLTDSPTSKPADSSRIDTPAQAKQTIQQLERYLRQRGDIGAIAILSPRILELLPDNSTIHYLYALAMAAQGEVDKASKMLPHTEPAEDDRLYDLLAKSAIAKASDNFSEGIEAAEQAIRLDPAHPYAYNILGQIAVTKKKYQDAISYFSKAVEKAPQFAAALSNLGAVHLIQADTAEAWQSYTKALAVAPEFCPALLGRAALASQLGDMHKAIVDLETCIQSEPDQLHAKQRLIAMYLQQGELEKARKLIESSDDLDPDFAQMTLAEIALRNNKPAAARVKLNGLHHGNAQRLYLMSLCEAMEHKFDAALASIEQAETNQPESTTLKLARQVYAFAAGKPVDREALMTLRSDPRIGAIAAFLLGNIAASNNDFQQAAEYWRQARDLLPGFILSGLSTNEIRAASSVNEQRQLSLGMLFYLKAYYPTALSEFEQALTINSDSFMANFLYALTLAQTDKSDSGVPYLLRSVKQAPGFFPANYMLAEHYLRTGDIKHAITYYRNAANSEPDQGVLIKLGLLYESQEMTEDAANIYRIFIKNHAESFLGYNQLAWLFAKQGINLTEALELAHTADRIRPENASVNDTLGWIYYQQQNYSLADKLLHKANDISRGRNPDILYHLASVMVKQQELTQAKTYLEQALAISDNFETAAQAKQLLMKIGTTGS